MTVSQQTTGTDERYAVASPLEISQILQGLARCGALVTAYPDGSEDFFLTAIVGIDDDAGCLWLDGAPGAQQARQAGATALRCVGVLEKVQIHFECDDVESGTLDGRPAFRAALPQTLTRLQRREHFRIDTPLAAPLKCAVTLTRDERPVNVTLTVLDISCGGMALLTPPGEFEPRPGERYPCTITLPGAGALRLTLEAQHTRKVKSANGKETVRSGFALVAPTAQVLTAIQRYIMQLERERRAKFMGG